MAKRQLARRNVPDSDSSGSPPADRSQSEFPKHELQRAISVARAIEDFNGGNPMPPTDIAISLGVSPGSSDFRVLLSSSFKYGLTTGSYRQEKITLTELGRAVVLPVSDVARADAERQAALSPPVFRAIYEHFKGKKLPEGMFFENTVVREFGVPRSHSSKCVEIVRANFEQVGLLKKASTGMWVTTEPATALISKPFFNGSPSENGGSAEIPDEGAPYETHSTIPLRDMKDGGRIAPDQLDERARRVFVSHGRSRELVPQLKELLTFGQFEPVVSVERETVSKPVPDKVMDDMRSCGAAIIHVDAEQEVITADGTRQYMLNQNVLIEIGAAMALYKDRFILLVRNGVKLPTNLQGLYEVRYEGEKLDGEATLRLLKAFNEFKKEERTLAR